MKMIHKKYIILFILSIFLLSCERHEKLSKLKTYIAEVKQTVNQNKNNSGNLTIRLPTPVIYQDSVPLTNQETGPLLNANAVVMNPLQAYSLQSYQFLGTLSIGQHIWAYVLVPGNNVYQLKKEDILGNQGGKVIGISRDKLEILIQTNHAGKQAVQRIITLRLKE